MDWNFDNAPFLNEPLEEPVKDGPGNPSNGIHGLNNVLSLRHPLRADLDPWLAERFHDRLWVDPTAIADLCCNIHCVGLTLLVATLLLEPEMFCHGSKSYRDCSPHLSHGHDGSGQPVAVPLVLLGEAKDVKGAVGVLQLLIVVDGGDRNFALRHIGVILIESVEIYAIL